MQLDEAMVRTALKLHAQDNVATALRDLHAGERPVVDGDTSVPVLRDAVTRGHKFALEDIPHGGSITT